MESEFSSKSQNSLLEEEDNSLKALFNKQILQSPNKIVLTLKF